MNDRLLRAARRQPTDTTPVWLMRQAGRYLPEYRAIRGTIAFLDLCKNPDLAAEVTVQPITRLGVDAAIIFSDILIPVEAMGIELELGDKGPHFPNPVRSAADIERLGVPDPVQGTGFVAEAIRRNIMNAVERMTGLSVERVNVVVHDVKLPKDESEAEDQAALNQGQA